LRSDCPPDHETAVEGKINMIVYQPVSVEKWEAAQFQVRSTLGRIHDFNPRDEAAAPMWDTIETASMFDEIFQSLGLFLGSVALVTLTLGGVGVMNTMLTSVAERTPEIGLKKALGATKARIMVEFFFEGIVLALVSGAGGIALVAGLAALVNSFPMPAMFSGLPLNFDVVALLSAALGGVALFSALPPAWRAANFTPVEALNYEK
jgi:putative ABC transport system permease protein